MIRGHKCVKTLSLSFVTNCHRQSARALKMERFRQCEVTEGGKTLNTISLLFTQAIGSLGWVGEYMSMSKPPEISGGRITKGGFSQVGPYILQARQVECHCS